ncbi:MAG: galactokinase [Planctomycetia bacterium]|nr:galactokinase [Planctomycetia bacterium]
MNDFLATVRALVARAELFSPAAPVCVARAPGRLDLMGGNDDYTGGMVFEATIREATWAAVQTRDDGRIVLVNPQMRAHGWQERVECSLDDLASEAGVRALVNRSPAIRWTAYVLGLFYYLRSRAPDHVRRGATVYIESDVPLNKGVSSSAAIEVAAMKATASAYRLPIAGVDLAEACQWAENVIAESACGIMDQIAVVLGDEGHVLPLVCQPCQPQPLVRLPAGLACRAVDSGVSHAVTGIEYEAARAAAFMGYKLICDWEGLAVRPDEDSRIPRFTDERFSGYLANLSPSLFRARYETRLPERMTGAEYLRIAGVHVDPFTKARPEVTYAVRACTRYAVEENQRVRLFAELARRANETNLPSAAALMGELMYQSHHGYTETGLGNEATDLLVQLARDEGPAHGIFGAKVTGGGAGGTVAVLGLAESEAAFGRIVERYATARGAAPYVFRGSSPGADRFGVVEVRPC